MRRGEVLGARACDVEEEVQGALWSNMLLFAQEHKRQSVCECEWRIRWRGAGWRRKIVME